MVSRQELERIPVRYRWLVKIMMKLPNPALPFFALKHFPEFEGILWALVVPLSLSLFFWVDIWFISFLSSHISFPLNVIIGFLVPAIPFVFFLRVQLERAFLWWKGIHEQPRDWQTSKRVEEFIEILNKQQKRKKS